MQCARQLVKRGYKYVPYAQVWCGAVMQGCFVRNVEKRQMSAVTLNNSVYVITCRYHVGSQAPQTYDKSSMGYGPQAEEKALIEMSLHKTRKRK